MNVDVVPPRAERINGVKAVGSAIADLIARAPGAARLLRAGALAPVRMKSPVFEYVFCALGRRSHSLPDLIETNAGITDQLRLMIPSRKWALLYGRPQNSAAERATLELAVVLARLSAAFLDVGANEGLFTFFAAADPLRNKDCEIHAFEPDADLFARLDANLRRNGIAAVANQAAVGATSGTAIFNRNLTDDLSGSLSDYFADCHQTCPVSVRLVALSDYMNRAAIEHACVKVDVEGAGAGVWEGLRGALDRVDWLIFEMLEPEHAVKLPARIISESGFCAYYIRDFELVPSKAGEFEYRAPFYNWLLCRHDPASLASLLAGTRLRVRSEQAVAV